MLKNPRVIGVKNSSMPVQDIQMWRDEGGIVFKGPDEQFVSLVHDGAVALGQLPELYLKAWDLFYSGQLEKARQVQNECCRIIYKMCSAQGNMYAVIKEIIRLQGGPDVGGVRAPLTSASPAQWGVFLKNAAAAPPEGFPSALRQKNPQSVW